MTTQLDAPLSLAARRVRRRRQLTVRLAAGSAVAAVVAAVVVWLLAFSQFFAASVVQVVGTNRTDSQLVRDALAPYEGVPLARVSSGDVNTEVISAVASVRETSVKRSWPDTLVVRVTERAPVGIATSSGEEFLVDGTGTLFNDDGSRDNLPVVVPAAETDDGELLRACVTVLDSLSGDLRSEVVKVDATSSVDVTLTLTGKRSVVWGGASDSERKAKVLDTLVKQGGTRFNVSSPDLPVVRS